LTLVTANAYERVVRIEYDDGMGSGVVIERGDQTYCVTARHVLPDPPRQVTIQRRGDATRLLPRPVDGIPETADLAVFQIPNELARPDLPLPLTSDGLAYSQEVLFLGYPYGLALRVRGHDVLPFVKRATLSASDTQIDGVQVWYLDGFNNPGFSGGPVVAAPIANRDALQLMAIVSGFRIDWQNMHAEGQEVPDLRVAGNSGIVIAYDIQPVVDLLVE
jgi:S1-C subfamily serine protease